MALSGWHCWIIFFFILLTNSNILPSSAASDSELLLKVKENLENNAGLSSWNTSNPPCTNGHANWRGILCYQGKVWGVKLENMGLKGVIDVESLKALPYLRTLSFMNNDLEGPWPEIHRLIGLKSIYLSNNKFSGEIPFQTFQGLQWLKKIHLSNNQFTGEVPISVASLPRLLELRLDGNQFTGAIPRFHRHRLRSFSVANNQLHGQIPPSLSKFPVSSFSGNERLCGTPLEACKAKTSTVSIIVAVVVVCVAVIVIGAVIFILHRRRQRSAACIENSESGLSKGRARDISNESRRSSSISSNRSRRGGEHMRLSFLHDDRERFDLQELLRASAEILGSGCFSSSYKASLLDGPTIVVKRFKQMNNVGKEEFQEHMRRIGRLSHPNLLPPVAYYYRKEEKLMVTDFVQNGSLAVRLHGHQSLGEPSLDWPIRLKIVKGIAKGLEYLYRDMPRLIAPHGNLKSSNVLLTESFEPLLTDYGLVPVINQELAQDIMVIYKSPEYLQQGRITKKTDVWCLGILILEILTGKFPANFLQQGKGSEVSLASWVHSVVPEEWTNAVFDQEMGATQNCEGEMGKLLKIALCCCEGDVDKRWDLKEAVEKIQEVKQRDHDQENFYTSYASEADLKSST
ncbi:pollen receptor-like kinase 1 [Cajanus cajan]|uniref:pollen receptor-like kinase 1 n=1 Tax=Cajanus cajan TaxID=3821 RepID=UPI00098DBF07|nr:pollen receptor-like kinase 1 [Cajanus cajan]